MHQPADFEQHLKAAVETTAAELDRRILNAAAERLQPCTPKSRRGRLTMPRLLTITAAAMMVLALVLYPWHGQPMAFAEVQAQVARTSSMKYRMVAAQGALAFDVAVNSEGVVAYHVQGNGIGQGGMTVVVSPQGAITVKDHAARHMRIIRPDDEMAKSFLRLRGFLGEFRDLRSNSVETLKDNEIDGRMVIGFRVRREAVGELNDPPIDHWTIWADPKTKLPVRIECGSDWTSEPDTVMDRFDFEPKLDKSLFDQTPPAGWTVEEEPVSATDATTTP